MLKYRFLVGLIALLWVLGVAAVVPTGAAVGPSEVGGGVLSTADHSRFKELDREFSSGTEVTKACLKCHNLAALQVHDTIHWTWEGRKDDKPGEGKAKTLNNF